MNLSACISEEAILESCLLDTKSSFKNPSFTIYPNPVSDYLFIDNNSGRTIIRIDIYNSYGGLVRSENSITDNLSTYGLPQGQYYMQIVTDAEISRLTFIK